MLIQIKNDTLDICQCDVCENCYFDTEKDKKLCQACSRDIHKF